MQDDFLKTAISGQAVHKEPPPKDQTTPPPRFPVAHPAFAPTRVRLMAPAVPRKDE